MLGDSTIKNIQARKMKECIKPRKEIYVTSFSGAIIADMHDCSIPDMIILHSGTNDLKSTKSREEIANDIIKLTLDTKTHVNEVVVSGIISKDDKLNEKGVKVNDFIKIECTKYL